MIICLYGPDDYRILQKKNSIISEFEKKHSIFGLERFDFTENDDFYKFRDFIRAQSIFDRAKLAVVANAFEAPEKELKPALKEALELPRVTVILAQKEKPKAAFQFVLHAPAIAQVFEVLGGKALETFAAKEAEKAGLRFAPDALRFLLQVYEGNTWGFIMEIKKAGALGKEVISKADLEHLGLEITPDFWRTLYSVKSSIPAERLSALERLFAKDEPAAKIFNVVASLWREKIPQIAGYDIAIKSGKLDYEEALVDLVI